jgi:hypothetical protein
MPNHERAAKSARVRAEKTGRVAFIPEEYPVPTTPAAPLANTVLTGGIGQLIPWAINCYDLRTGSKPTGVLEIRTNGSKKSLSTPAVLLLIVSS